MKIICTKAELMKGINIVMKAIPSKTTMKILECILIEASGSQIRMTGNDMELGIDTSISGIVEKPGMIALDAKLFSEIVRKLPDNDVYLETDDRFLTTIRCEKSHFQIMGRDGEEFTPLPVLDRDEPVTISQFSLKEMIRQTLFSVAAGDSNMVMTGELFEIMENNFRMISLDGHRISMRRMTLTDYYPSCRVIVPGKTLSEISKILSGELSEMVSIYFSENHIMFEFAETVVVSRLIEGKFFDVDKMIARDFETKIYVNRMELMNCIDRSTLLVREDDKKPVVMDINDERMNLQIQSQLGFMDESVGIDKDGKDLRIGFNPKLLMDALRVVEDEMIMVYFVNSKSPCIIRNDDNTYLYLILPVNFIG